MTIGYWLLAIGCNVNEYGQRKQTLSNILFIIQLYNICNNFSYFLFQFKGKGLYLSPCFSRNRMFNN
jgi:hypothetical protein